MDLAQSLRKQHLDRATEQVARIEAEQLAGVIVDEHDLAAACHDQRRVRRGIEQRPREIISVSP
jgi:hypothetical protein